MKRPETRDGDLAVVEVLPGHALDLLRVDGLDAEAHLGGRDA
eukprot:CAMPEP_0168388428 /NCGR_PEP_ID=MMETSP0228-20121227/16446_1 /TAXON_ID=133427 /ORGANISM="Protoceratium reticulatum, Strain CCCM 535 (=CCMP 1889)" /LENGTH=41 /DNA_ID= /DNA_START= /DNA_END= /DNA_ORIENTATION=